MEAKPESSRWQAVAAIGTALAAVVALAAYFWPNSSASGTAGGQVPSYSTAPSAGQGGTSVSASQSPTVFAAPQAPAVLTQATVRVSETDGSSVDVGDMPLTVGTNGVASFWACNGKICAGISETTVIAAWPGPGNPTAAGCASLLRTQPIASIVNHPGLRFCMEGVFTHRVAAGTVLSYDGSVSEVKIIVWDEQLD